MLPAILAGPRGFIQVATAFTVLRPVRAVKDPEPVYTIDSR